MNARDVERYLHDNIPLSVAMGVRVRAATPERMELAAPLAPNLNHHETLFGGSASAVAILSAWALVHARLQRSNVAANLVIQRSTVSYEEPVRGDFTAVCELNDETRWRRFLAMLERRSRARITMHAGIWYAGRRAVSFEGDFVALLRRSS